MPLRIGRKGLWKLTCCLSGLVLVSRSQTPPLFDMSKRGGVWLRDTRLVSRRDGNVTYMTLHVVLCCTSS